MRVPLIALALLLQGCAAPRSLFATDGEPLWIAHRGRSTVAPENTLAAVEAALTLESSPRFIEIDVHLTADGQLAVIHDATLDRTTQGSGVVAEIPYEFVRTADARYAERFGDRFAGEPVPNLADVLDAVRPSPVGVMIEVKSGGAGGQAAALVMRRGELARHVLASFHADVIVHASMIAPSLRTMLLVTDPGPEHVELAVRAGASVIAIDHVNADADLIRRAHRAGLALWTWTVNDPARAAELRALGVDGIISDDPQAARLQPAEITGNRGGLH